MHIQRIELMGFKSFKNKTVLEFNEGITGIVGPNGCGKSNIVDALLWVMGETAPKHLRSTSLSDVIFAGTSNHPPAEIAEVSLVLEKEEGGIFPEKYNAFSELMITRRSVRNGDTDYFINQQPCRLKDIREIFMNTGAGCRGFSIIEQESVERLITAKPHERRFIIEEVAGITKFKTRKHESLRKLDKVNHNLKRVDDIIKQQDNQLNHLSRQAKKAEKYREIKKELRSKELELGHLLWDELLKKQEDFKNQVVHSENRKKILLAQKEDGKKELEQLEIEIKEKEQSLEKEKTYLSQVNLKILEREKDIEKHTEAIEIHSSQLQSQDSSTKNFKHDISKRKSRIQELEEEQKKLRTKEHSLRDEMQLIDNFLKQENSQLGEGREKWEIFERELKKTKENFNQIQLEANLNENKQNTLRQRNEQLSQEKETLEQDLKKVLKDKNNSNTLLEKSRQMKLSFMKDTDELQKNIDTLESRKGEMQEEVNQIKEELSLLKYKAENLDKIINKFENLKQGAEDLKSWKPDQFKPLMQSLKVEQGFEDAVEAALGFFLQAFVTSNDQTVSQGIEYLKVNQKGKCLFFSQLPINKDPYFKKEDFKKYPAFLCTLDEKMKFNLDTEPLKILARQTAVVSDIASAMELKKQFPQVQFVTKEGDLITKESFIYGGSSESKANFLKIRNEKSEAALELKNKQSLFNMREAEFNKLSAQLKLSIKSFDEIKNSNVQMDVTISEHKKDVEALEKELLRVTDHKKSIESQLKNTVDEEELVGKKLSELTGEKEHCQQTIQTKENTLNHIKEAQAKYKTEESRKMELNTELVNSLNQQNLYENEIQLLTQFIHQSENKEKEIVSSRSGIETTIQEENETIEELKKELHLYLQEKGQIESKIYDQQSLFEAKKEEVQLNQKQLFEITESHNNLERSEESGQVEQEKLEIQKENLKEKFLENHQFQLGKDSFIPQYEGISIDEFRESIVKLSKQIETVGGINMVALEEYEELLKENTFLKTQQEDLIQSKGDLSKVISHIDRMCDKRFKNMLDEINQRFSRIFPILFEGDQAEARLVLKEDSEKDDLGVDIVVRPPGKKTQSVTLLSRGEKALTSLCLIYSLFLVKPSPFCVLDEIDAPLDDANVFRYISVMKEMAKRSQIITITHNKYTMQACRELYGVTMKEKGVSQIVSVNLENPEKLQNP